MSDPRTTPTRPGALGSFLWLCLALAAGPAAAHKLQVFAFADGARIEGSVYFAGGARAQGATVKIEDGQGRVLALLTPASDGTFGYVAQAPVDHTIVADSGDGHRAEWRVSAAELAAGFPRAASGAALAEAPARPSGPSAPPAQSAAPAASAGAPTSIATPIATPIATGPAPGLDPALESMIERAVARQVRPLREELMAAQDQARLHDILGGIGYILGLTGIALWWRARRSPTAS